MTKEFKYFICGIIFLLFISCKYTHGTYREGRKRISYHGILLSGHGTAEKWYGKERTIDTVDNYLVSKSRKIKRYGCFPGIVGERTIYFDKQHKRIKKVIIRHRKHKIVTYPSNDSPNDSLTITTEKKMQTGKLTGRILLREPADTATLVEKVMLQLNLPDGKVYCSGIEKNLSFYYDGLAGDTTELRITTIAYYQDTIIKNIIIDVHKNTYLEIPYPPHCAYDKLKNDSICPVCNKQDQVVRIVYEPFPNPPKGRKKRNKYWREHNFTTGCDQHWYCQRDDKKF